MACTYTGVNSCKFVLQQLQIRTAQILLNFGSSLCDSLSTSHATLIGKILMHLVVKAPK